MPLIRVVKPFQLNLGDNKLIQYLVGVYDVDEATADHWYVKAHLEGFVEPPAPSPFTQRSLEVAQAVRMAEPVAEQTQPPAPPPPNAELPLRTSEVPEGAQYFAGQPQQDKPMPGQDPVSFAGTPQRRPPPRRST